MTTGKSKTNLQWGQHNPKMSNQSFTVSNHNDTNYEDGFFQSLDQPSDLSKDETDRSREDVREGSTKDIFKA